MNFVIVRPETIIENSIPIFEADFPMDFGCFFQTFCVFLIVKTPSAPKLQNSVMESFAMESIGLNIARSHSMCLFLHVQNHFSSSHNFV